MTTMTSNDLWDEIEKVTDRATHAAKLAEAMIYLIVKNDEDRALSGIQIGLLREAGIINGAPYAHKDQIESAFNRMESIFRNREIAGLGGDLEKWIEELPDLEQSTADRVARLKTQLRELQKELDQAEKPLKDLSNKITRAEQARASLRRIVPVSVRDQYAAEKRHLHAVVRKELAEKRIELQSSQGVLKLPEDIHHDLVQRHYNVFSSDRRERFGELTETNWKRYQAEAKARIEELEPKVAELEELYADGERQVEAMLDYYLAEDVFQNLEPVAPE